MSLIVFDAQSHIDKEAYYKEKIRDLYISCHNINPNYYNRSSRVSGCFATKIFSLLKRLEDRQESDFHMVMTDIYEDCIKMHLWDAGNCYSMHIRGLFKNWDIFFPPEKEGEEVVEEQDSRQGSK